MEIVIRFSPACPHRELAVTRVQAALVAAGLSGVSLHQEQVDADDTPGWSGSPSILIDGDDPFAAPPNGGGRTCRMYRTEVGLEGAPSVAAIRRALEEAIRGSGHTPGAQH